MFYEHLDRSWTSKETIPLLDALGRTTVQSVFSPINVPPFDRAAMDGFAVRASDTVGAEEDSPIDLEVIGEIKAGYVFDGIVDKGQTVEISTGAPMPTGANAVVMVEFTNRERDRVKITKAVTPSQHTMSAGADIQHGERILAAGTHLTSRELAVLAAIGLAEIEVYRLPRIAVFSSGDEIIPPGTELLPGKLYDINSTAIMSSLLENGGNPEFKGIITDQRQEITKQLAAALDSDLIVISGGTSAGMGDVLYEVIDELGEPGLLVHGVQVKPGKPTILAVCNGTPIVGLPGYPASALSILQLFVLPLVREMAHLAPLSSGSIIKALTRQRLRSVEGRYEFKPMYLIRGVDSWIAYPVPGGSGAITSVALADGFVQIPENTHFVPAGEEIEIHLISDQIKPPALQIIGSQDLAMTRLEELFETRYPGMTIRSVGVGSSGGVTAVRRGEAHLAGVHLLDPEKGYNAWLAEKEDVIVIPGFYRMQGLIVPKGNPKEIYGLDDLITKDVLFMNRNNGSGTRVLLDLLLDKMSADTEKIRGYKLSAKSHFSAAETVANGHADVSVGIESVAQVFDLDFIELRDEEYDLIINKEYTELDAVRKFIELFQSDEFRAIIDALPGYRSKSV
jgi:putative molybdopterin biosynthesis protein